MDFTFFLNSILLGVGLAMDAFSVSIANGLNEPHMKSVKVIGIAGVFGIFQALMPIIGWVCVHTVLQYFSAFEKFIPWIALLLLGYIGFKMVIDGIRSRNTDSEKPSIGIAALLIQGIATSIDALSVGFTIAEYNWLMALAASLIIALVTFIICIFGLRIGKRFGTRLAHRASVFGGAILIAIGIEIFISGILK